MKINNQENWVSIFTILINFIDFHRYYRFFLFRFNLSEKRNGQVISFVLDKRKEIQRKFLIVGTHFIWLNCFLDRVICIF